MFSFCSFQLFTIEQQCLLRFACVNINKSARLQRHRIVEIQNDLTRIETTCRGEISGQRKRRCANETVLCVLCMSGSIHEAWDQITSKVNWNRSLIEKWRELEVGQAKNTREKQQQKQTRIREWTFHFVRFYFSIFLFLFVEIYLRWSLSIEPIIPSNWNMIRGKQIDEETKRKRTGFVPFDLSFISSEFDWIKRRKIMFETLNSKPTRDRNKLNQSKSCYRHSCEFEKLAKIIFTFRSLLVVDKTINWNRFECAINLDFCAFRVADEIAFGGEAAINFQFSILIEITEEKWKLLTGPCI